VLSASDELDGGVAAVLSSEVEKSYAESQAPLNGAQVLRMALAGGTGTINDGRRE
jgi:hypothetical protein